MHLTSRYVISAGVALFLGQLFAAVDVAIDLSAGDQTVNVPAGETGVVKSFVGSTTAKLTVAGGGTLEMGDFAKSGNTFAGLALNGAMIEVSDRAQLGTGPVAVSQNGGIRALATINFSSLKKLLTVTDGITIDVAENATFTIQVQDYAGADATLTKLGKGTLSVGIRSLDSYLVSGHWLIREGVLTTSTSCNAQTPFGRYETDVSDLELEIYEGAQMRHLGGLPKLTLRGGRLTNGATAVNKVFAMTAGDVLDRLLVSSDTKEAIAPMLNRGVRVLPSTSGAPSVIDGYAVCLSQIRGVGAQFDVAAGAQLDVCAPMVVRRLNVNGKDVQVARKTGAGTIRILSDVRTEGDFVVEAGELVLGKGVSNVSSMRFRTDGGTIRLEDGAAIRVADRDPVLATAAVWFDPTQVSYADGVAPSRILNLGTLSSEAIGAGGFNGTSLLMADNRFGSLSAFSVNGKQGAYFGNYENTGSALTVFVVARNTSWESANQKGLNGRPFEIGDRTTGWPTAAKTLTVQFPTASKFTVNFGATSIPFENQGIAPTDTTAFLDEIVWNGMEGAFRQWWSDDADPVEWSGEVPSFPSGEMVQMSIGTRLYQSTYHAGSSGPMVGDIGEILVFNRVLTAEETAYVRSYLQRRWFGSRTAALPLPAAYAAAGAEADVKVESGKTGLLMADGAHVRVTKTGEGTLQLSDGGAGSAGQVAVNGGTLAIVTNGWRRAAAVWVDGSDASTVTTEGDVVVSVANKGSAGGSFVVAETYAGTGDARPKTATINGRTALSFDGEQGLQFDGFAPNSSRVEEPLSVYIVAERTEFVANAGPFALTRKGNSGYGVAGEVFIWEAARNNANTRIWLQVANGQQVLDGAVDSGSPFIDICSSRDNVSFLSQVSALVPPSNGPRKVFTTGNTAGTVVYEPSNTFNRVILGGAANDGKLDGRTSGGKKFHRGWKGRIGEFIVITKPLSYAEEKELVDYLYDKWIAVPATAAAATPFLLGGSGTAVKGGDLDFSFADGAGLTMSAPAVAARDLSFLGSMALWYSPLPEKGSSADLFRYAGSVFWFSGDAWTVTGTPDVRGNLKVRQGAGVISLRNVPNGLSILVR